MKILRNKTMPLLFLLALCLLLSACDLTEVSFEAQSSTELGTSDETSQQPPYKKEIIGLDHALISTLTEHIDFLDAFIDHTSPAYSIDLDSFQYRRQVFFVKFDKDNYYLNTLQMKIDADWPYRPNRKWVEEEYEPDPTAVYKVLFVEKTRMGANSSDTGNAYLLKFSGDHCIFREVCQAKIKHGQIT